MNAIHQEGDNVDEFELLGDDPACNKSVAQAHLQQLEARRSFGTTPLLTGDVFNTLPEDTFPQVALYGRVLLQCGSGLPNRPVDGRLFVNTNAPFSAVVCGVQVRSSVLTFSNLDTVLTYRTGIREKSYDLSLTREHAHA
jgi:hypothetical protein